ncbi:hypothetical protein P5E85_02270 [Clostridium perfringens]|uniref:hypothetical protein n=1 Tax=Clostridium perfringens TaxID=1502 RepID=UPI002A33C646|nr:hypothetical protein [Clostridium perfringens]
MSQKNLLSYCHGTLEKGSVLSMAKATPVVEAMPFIQIRGNAYSYNVVDTLLPTEHRELGADVVASELESTKVTKSLVILTNSVKTDRALGVMSDITDIKVEGQHLAMVSSGKALEKKVIAELKQMLTDTVAGTKLTGELTIDLVDDALDAVPNANMIFVNNKGHRTLKKLFKAEGYTPVEIEAFGRRVVSYNGIPVVPSQDLGDNEILVVKFAEDGVHGITNGGLRVYEKEVGVFHVADTELLYNVVAKIKNSFALVEFTGGAVLSVKAKK